MATLYLHAAFIDAPILSCSFDWFDARHNKKGKHLKEVTVDFVFGKDGGFVPGNSTPTPTPTHTPDPDPNPNQRTAASCPVCR